MHILKPSRVPQITCTLLTGYLPWTRCMVWARHLLFLSFSFLAQLTPRVYDSEIPEMLRQLNLARLCCTCSQIFKLLILWVLILKWGKPYTNFENKIHLELPLCPYSLYSKSISFYPPDFCLSQSPSKLQRFYTCCSLWRQCCSRKS